MGYKTYKNWEEWAEENSKPELYTCDHYPKWNDNYSYGDPYASKYGYENYDEEWN